MPLSFDMPFEELQRYQGTNPRPDDYDAFWDRSLTEMQSIDPEIELVEAYDDICVRCVRRVRDEKGSVWGEEHSCSSSRDPNIVKNVARMNGQVLQKLGLAFGSVIGLQDLVELMRERMPTVASPEGQEYYKKGLAVLTSLLGSKGRDG